jgi:YHS domain-containing protein
MSRFLVFILLIYIVYRLFRKKEPRRRTGNSSSPRELVQDPQCQIYFPKDKALSLKSNGETLYFCSEECRKAFKSGKKKKPD